MRKALVVGIDQYTGCPLHGCCNDADAIANVLSKMVMGLRILT